MTDSSSGSSPRRSRRRGGRGRTGQSKPAQQQQPQGPVKDPDAPRRPDVIATPLDDLEGAFRDIIDPIKRAVAEEGYRTPTPIQEQTIPVVLAGRDVMGCAQTGTGKTAAFTLPILQMLHAKNKPAEPGRPRCLILAPTRELAAQIGDCIRAYGRNLPLKHHVIYGGVNQNPQAKAMQKGVDILVATPGRLLDLMNQGVVILDQVEIYVLDEADRMLDMGFIPDIRRISAKLPRKRQSLFLSATLPPAVVTLAHEMVHDPVTITVDPGKPAVERIGQCVLFVDNGHKQTLLTKIMSQDGMDKVIIFTRTKHGANKVSKQLNEAGITASPIHGNKSQAARTRALEAFRIGTMKALVATDIAARGIDVDGVTHVINFNLPDVAETYVHRIGRTARAGSEGDAITLCSADERDYLRDIEKLLAAPLPVLLEHDFHSETARNATGAAARPAPRAGGGGGGGGGGRRGGGGGGGRGRSGGGGGGGREGGYSNRDRSRKAGPSGGKRSGSFGSRGGSR